MQVATYQKDSSFRFASFGMTFFQLLSYVSAGFDYSKSFHHFKKIFRQAGKVRDLHVQSHLLKNIEKQPGIKLPEQRDKILKKEKKEFKSFHKEAKKAPKHFH